MAILEILQFPDSRLRTKAVSVSTFDQALKQFVDDLFETMYAAPGIGLAATQVNVHKKIIVMDISEDKSEPLVFINPEIEVIDQEEQQYDEGCLSVPGFFETISRPQSIRISAHDREGDRFQIQADGLLAICLQHEVDHLNGKLFVDYLSTIKRQRIRSKLVKEQKSRAVKTSS